MTEPWNLQNRNKTNNYIRKVKCRILKKENMINCVNERN